MTDTNSWNNDLVAAFNIQIIWYVDLFWWEYGLLVSPDSEISAKENLMKYFRSVDLQKVFTKFDFKLMHIMNLVGFTYMFETIKYQTF